MYQIELLPAAHGDALWIEYGDARHPCRVVIDGGPAPTYELGLRRRIEGLPARSRQIDLFVVTHIDADHIDGAIILLQEAAALGVRFGEVWFNAWPQLEAAGGEVYKPVQGEFLGALLQEIPAVATVWNARTQGAAVVTSEAGALPRYELPGDARLTLLSPGPKQLKRLRSRWSAAIREFSPGDRTEALKRLAARREYRPPEAHPVFGERGYGDDRSVANGSSIAFVLEYDGVSCLFGGDAHPRVLAESLRRLTGSGPLRLDAVKLPHHGSLSNVSEEFVAAVDCRRWLVSTNGASFGHPDRETAELIAKHSSEPPEFLCNYRSPTTEALADRSAQPRWLTCYPSEGVPPGPVGGFAIELSGRPAERAGARSAARRGAAARRGRAGPK